MTAPATERTCGGCGVDISDRRRQATTCGSARCWKRMQRRRDRERQRAEDRAQAEALPTIASATEIAAEDSFSLHDAVMRTTPAVAA